MRGDGGQDGDIVLRALRSMGGRGTASAARAIAYRLMGKRSNKWRGFDITLGMLIDAGTIRVCSDGKYEIPPTPPQPKPIAIHRGTTFYSDPQFMPTTPQPPSLDDWTGLPRAHTTPQRGIHA